MIKNKLIIFMILALAMLSIGVASAEDSSSLNTTDTVDEVVTSDLNSVDVVLDDDNSQLQSDEVKSSNLNNEENNVIKSSSMEDNELNESQTNNYGVLGASSDNDVLTASPKSFTELETQINGLSDGATLNLYYDYKYTGASNYTGINITKNNIVIDGHGHTLDANNNGRIFNIIGQNVVIKNLIFINAYAFVLNVGGAGGSAINILPGSSHVTVFNSTFINCNSNQWGGAIHSAGSYVTISKSTFINNSCEGSGGAFDSRGNYPQVIDSVFINNTATMVNGGAIEFYNSTIFEVTNSDFINNNAVIGGALSFYLAGDGQINNSTFVNNNGRESSGAIRNTGGHIDIYNSKFINNSAIDGVIHNGKDSNSDFNSTLDLRNNIYLGVPSDRYCIFNEDGSNLTSAVVTVLGNQTVTTPGGKIFRLYATVSCDNTTVGGRNQSLYFKVNGSFLKGVGLDSGLYVYDYSTGFNNQQLIGGLYYGVSANNLTVKSGILEVGKGNSNTSVSVEDIVYGETATLNIKVTADVDTVAPAITGNVTVYVDGREYKTVNLANGVVNLDISSLSAGQHKINVTYNGDNNYGTSTGNVTVNVNQTTPTITIDMKDIVYGTTGTINVTVNKYMNGVVPTGNVTINVAGRNYTVKLANGVAKLSVSGLNAGNYKVNVTYNGDSNYTVSNKSISFNVDKLPTNIDVNVDSISYGENATIKVNVTPGATGNVTIHVGGKDYTLNLTNGEVSLIISNLTGGNYPIIATYNGNTNYETSTNDDVSFDVSKVDPSIVIKVLGDVQDNYNITIAVIVPYDAIGTVNLTVSNDVYSETFNDVKVENGTAKILIPFLEYGIYNLDANYSGDKNYNPVKADSLAFVPKLTNYTMNITVNPSNPVLGDDVNIKVDLPENATGEVTITINGEEHTLNLTDGSANITIANIGAGKYDIKANYSGDNQYTAKNNSTSFEVSKEDAKLNVEIGEVVIGQPTNINVTLTTMDGAPLNGTVVVKINNKPYTVTVTDGEGVIENIVFNKTGNYAFIASWDGDNNYNSALDMDFFEVSHITDYTMNVSVDPINVGENATVKVKLPENATGWVIVESEGNYYIGNVTDGIAVITVPGLTNGTHTLSVTYDGDDNYSSKNKTVDVVVSKISDYPMNITVPDDVKVGENATITVNLPTDATGTVNLTVGDKTYTTSEIINGVAAFNVSGLTNGTYDIKAEYFGDGKYDSNTKYDEITVSKVDGYDIEVIVPEDVKVGENATVIVKLPENATGKVNITIGNETFTGDVENGTAEVNVTGLPAGDHNITVNYTGDDNYAPGNTTSSIDVSKIADYNMDVTAEDVKVGEAALIKVNLPTDATGNVTVNIGGVDYNASLTVYGWIAVINNLTAGKHNIIANYSGNDKYAPGMTTGSITVSKISEHDIDEYSIKIDAPEDVKVGDIAVINITLPNDINGIITVKIGNKTQYVPVTDGKASVTTDEFTEEGDYPITVTYGGNDKYTNNTGKASLIVSKISDYPIIIDVPTDIKSGDKATINVTLPDDINDNITIKVGDKEYNATVTNGKASVTTDEFVGGKYTVNVTYVGNNKYAYNSNTTSIIFKKTDYDMNVTVIPEDLRTGENATIKVDLPDDATGNVTVTVDGKNYTVPVNNGTAEVTLPVLPEGEYNVTVDYPGDENYADKSENTTITSKGDYDWTVIIPEVTDDKNATITVIVPDDATGNVTVTVNNQTYTAPVNNGTANVTLPILPAGKYDVITTYNGDENYAPKTNTTSIISKKTNYDINVTVIDPDTIGGNGTVIVDVPGDGNITITIDGNETITVPVENGTNNITLPVLPEGEHNITVNYTSDEYADKTKNATITSKGDYDWTVIIPEVRDDKNATITVIVPDDATGNVTVTVNNQTYTAPVNNGTAEVTLPILPAGKYDVTTTYNGDDKYAPKTNTTSIISKKTDYDMNVTVINPDKFGENATVVVDVPGNGTVIITIDGNKTIVAPVENGTNNITLPVLPEGEHNITVNYTSDEYVDKSQNATVISKGDYDWEVIIPEVRDDKNATITVIVPKDATGNVTVTVDGKDYTAPVNNGTAEITLPVLPAGKYDVITTYNGDENYAPKTNNTSIISKKTDYSINTTIPDELKPDVPTQFNVTVPDGGNGTVIIIIDGNKTITVNITNGTGNGTLPPLGPGDHDIVINYTGDDTHVPTSTNKTIKVVSNDVNLTANDVVMIYKDGSRLYAVLLDAYGNPIANTTLSFTINGVTYNRTTNVNGTASLAINLDYGVYKATISYAGNATYNPASVNATVTVNSSIIGNDLVKMWRNGTQFYATFLGQGAKPLANTNITFNINGVLYTRQTNANGTAKLNINLDPGNYTLTAYNPYSGEQRGFNVLVKPLIDTSDLTKYYINGSKFEAKVWNYDGSVAANTNVTFNINGVFYTRTADENGIVKLAITLRPGDYIITSMYEGLSIGNNVKVLPTLETSDISMKFEDGTKFQAKTLDGQGNPLANQNLTFNIHGVFYHKTTNDDGVAELNINLMKGEYIITSYWNDFETGNKIYVA